MQRRGLGMLLAGLAAYGYYKYSKMSADEKTKLKERGKKIVDENLGSLKNMFGRKTNSYSPPAGSDY